MRRRIMATILTIATILALSVSPALAWSAVNTKCYTITTGNTTVYNSTSTSSGKKGTIFASDEIVIKGSYSNGFYYVDYPISGGRKQGYILKSAVLINTSASTKFATRSITTYRRNNTSYTYGSIYKNDEVLVFGTRGNFTQVRYPVSGGYKFAWISKSDASNYLSSSKNSNNNNVKVSLSVPTFRQYDTRWKNVKIGTKTIGQIGCTTTCLAMKYSYQTGKTTYPNSMKSKLKYSNNDIIWSSVTNLGYTITGVYRTKITNNMMKTIYNQLKNGKPVIIGGVPSATSSSQHWVVVTGYKGTSNTSFSASNFTIIDPNNSGRTTLQDFLNYKPYVYKMIY